MANTEPSNLPGKAGDLVERSGWRPIEERTAAWIKVLRKTPLDGTRLQADAAKGLADILQDLSEASNHIRTTAERLDAIADWRVALMAAFYKAWPDAEDMPDDDEGIIGNVERLTAERDAARTTPDPSGLVEDDLRDMLAAAYEQGCRDTHENYEPQSDPEFGEAASDYATSALSVYRSTNDIPETRVIQGEGE